MVEQTSREDGMIKAKSVQFPVEEIISLSRHVAQQVSIRPSNVLE